MPSPTHHLHHSWRPSLSQGRREALDTTLPTYASGSGTSIACDAADAAQDDMFGMYLPKRGEIVRKWGDGSDDMVVCSGDTTGRVPRIGWLDVPFIVLPRVAVSDGPGTLAAADTSPCC